ncbi:MAG: putative thiol:disulfide interchange protein DsbC precursor [Betaproteobacteria bacterium ADurb.Bin341]|nr:MAG: putative thiol:disulfide interchange protein DsbC precursor [Betaproteobacteria bacterium ADurb.Bin341]
MFKILLAVGLAVCTLAAHADEAKVKSAVEARLGGKVTSVTKTRYLGLYEVYYDGNILYTDEKLTVFVAGPLIDAKTLKNITEERLGKFSAVKFSDLPLEQAIKQVRGEGKRVFATFEDPNCGYCKRLHKELRALDNATIYVFLLPMLSEDSLKKSKAIWCAEDRVKAWNDWMIEDKAPSGKGDCDASAISKNMAFAQKYRIQGTPTLFFADGERVPGAMPLARIEEKLNSQLK